MDKKEDYERQALEEGGVNPAVPAVQIDPLSVTSLYLKLYANGQQLSTATGFVVEHGGRRFLISNWHVFSGRNADTGEPLDSKTAALPDQVRVALHIRGGEHLTQWKFVRKQLYSSD